MYLLFRLHDVDVFDEETGETSVIQEPRLVAVYTELEAARARMQDSGGEDVPPTYPVRPRNRFAIYERAGDTDGDGFPDSFTFLAVYTIAVPEPQTTSVRKGKRAA